MKIEGIGRDTVHDIIYASWGRKAGKAYELALEFINTADTPNEIVDRIKDDPDYQRSSKKTYGIKPRMAWVIYQRLRLNGPFQSLNELDEIPGIGPDTLHDIVYSFYKNAEEYFRQRLTKEILDRLHRFTRLWKATGIRIGELDLLLNQIEREPLRQPSSLSTPGHSLNTQVIQIVSRVRRLQDKVDLSFEELTALWTDIPDQPVITSTLTDTSQNDKEGASAIPSPSISAARLRTPLFDRVFNQQDFVDEGGRYPQQHTQFLHPALTTLSTQSSDLNLRRLQAGIGTDEDGLLQLITGLATPLGVELDTDDEEKRKFSLNLQNLSLLYRHARLAKYLKISIPELFALMGIFVNEHPGYVGSLDDLEYLLKLYGWWKKTDWSISELVQITRRPVIVTSQAPNPSISSGERVAYTVIIGNEEKPIEEIRFKDSNNLNAIIKDWNAKAYFTEAYRSNKQGREFDQGDYLSIRSRSITAKTKIKISADSQSIFTPTCPKVYKNFVEPGILMPAVVDSRDQAQSLVDQVNSSALMEFTDTVFARMPETAPIATTIELVHCKFDTIKVSYMPFLNGHAESEEQIELSIQEDINTLVEEWNKQAKFTKAYRSTSTGVPSNAEAHFSITIEGASGSNTRLSIKGNHGIFKEAEYRGAEISEAQSKALIEINHGHILESAGLEGKYRLIQILQSIQG